MRNRSTNKMAKIQRLDPHLTNMIAAGEVVERPMGVVKEVVENSIDAGAKNIEIHIKEGGLQEIMIIDDGSGMSKEDTTMAFERHATSKIKDMNDLWRIHTMGFRGEALPSIASVAHVIIRSNDTKESTEVEIAYGEMKKCESVGTPKGTQIIIQNLFQKTPARLKHLKNPQYEFSLISDVIQKFALARSDIAFVLTHDGREVFTSKGNANQLEVIMEMYGRDCAKLAIPIEEEDEDYKVQGYAIQPSQSRANKYYMLVYINERMIRSFRLQKAIIDAYSPYLPKDRYPIVVLNIKMDPKLVDVNVHPSKWEVRLSKEKQLETMIKESIEKALQNKLEVTKVERKEKPIVESVAFEFTYPTEIKPSAVEKEVTLSVQEEFKEYVKTPVQEEPTQHKEEVKATIQEEPKGTPFVSQMARNPSFPQMEVIGQLHSCYILAQGENGLYIIDQHAAQERYHFESLQEMVLQGVQDSQPLLVPLTIESTIAALARIEDINTLFSAIGIQLEAFGSHTFVLRELPIWMQGVEEEKCIQDMLDYYLKNEEISLEGLRKHAIATLACHSSIRFHRNLTMDEMKKVIYDLSLCEQPFHCPHGRPTFIDLPLKDLEKDFLRVK